MMPSGHEDPLLRLLQRLPETVPDAAQGARVRQRMQAALRRRQRVRIGRQAMRRRLETTAVAGFSLAYAAVLVRQLLVWYGVL